MKQIQCMQTRATTALLCSLSVLLLCLVSAYADAKPQLDYRIRSPSALQPNALNRGSTFANSTYKDVTVPAQMTRPPIYQHNDPYYPPNAYPPQHRPYPQQYPYPPYPPHARQGYPQQNRLSIIYHQPFPSQTSYSTQSNGYVNGHHGTMQSSSDILISDWRRYNLPDPHVGMHWIYQDGRYLQIPNDR